MENLVFSLLREGAVCVLSVQDQPGQALVCSEARSHSASPVMAKSDRTTPVVLCKTVIQLDGDVISWVSPAVLARPELLDQHQAAVLRELQIASAFAQSWVRKVTTASVAVRWGGGTLILGGNATLWHTFASVVLPLVIGAGSLAAWHFGTRFVITRLALGALRSVRAL